MSFSMMKNGELLSMMIGMSQNKTLKILNKYFFKLKILNKYLIVV